MMTMNSGAIGELKNSNQAGLPDGDPAGAAGPVVACASRRTAGLSPLVMIEAVASAKLSKPSPCSHLLRSSMAAGSAVAPTLPGLRAEGKVTQRSASPCQPDG